MKETTKWRLFAYLGVAQAAFGVIYLFIGELGWGIAWLLLGVATVYKGQQKEAATR